MKIEHIAMYVNDLGGARLEIMNKPDMDDARKSLQRTGFIHIAFRVGSKGKVNLIGIAHLRIQIYALIEIQSYLQGCLNQQKVFAALLH